MDSTPASRSEKARIAALTRYAYCDPREATVPARAAFLRTFEDQVDPERKLSPDVREKRAAKLRRAHMLKLAQKSAEARRKKARKASARS